jgi:hypothetical protein
MYASFRRLKHDYLIDLEGKITDMQKNFCKHEKVWLIQIVEVEIRLLIYDMRHQVSYSVQG